MGKSHLNKTDPVPSDKKGKQRGKRGDSFEVQTGATKDPGVVMNEQMRERIQQNYEKSASRGKRF